MNNTIFEPQQNNAITYLYENTNTYVNTNDLIYKYFNNKLFNTNDLIYKIFNNIVNFINDRNNININRIFFGLFQITIGMKFINYDANKLTVLTMYGYICILWGALNIIVSCWAHNNVVFYKN